VKVNAPMIRTILGERR